MVTSTVNDETSWNNKLESMEPCNFPRFGNGEIDTMNVLALPVEILAGKELLDLLCNNRKKFISIMQSMWFLVLNSYTGLGDVNFQWKEFGDDSSHSSPTVAQTVRIQLRQEDSLADLLVSACKSYENCPTHSSSVTSSECDTHHNNTTVQLCSNRELNGSTQDRVGFKFDSKVRVSFPVRKHRSRGTWTDFQIVKSHSFTYPPN